MAAADNAEKIEVRSRADLRDWLAANHAQKASFWLVTWKKDTDHYVPFPDYVEELLCWGWIDSVPRKVDDTRTSTLISPRNPKSAWSGVNKRLVEQARMSGAMQPPGEAAISVAKKNGMWSFLDDVERLEMPDDLARAFGDLMPKWDAWPASSRRAWLEKIKTAKTDATRERRIAACVDAARSDAPFAGLR